MAYDGTDDKAMERRLNAREAHIENVKKMKADRSFINGGTILNDFAFALFVGFISGTYSTIYIASPLILAWKQKNTK